MVDVLLFKSLVAKSLGLPLNFGFGLFSLLLCNLDLFFLRICETEFLNENVKIFHVGMLGVRWLVTGEHFNVIFDAKLLRSLPCLRLHGFAFNC
ncbi:hypothetical protein EPI10_021764 [Gossypium australe]|uniref:Uncharacterized protein n=1 Tax=Gossypium australe TaxID=47621 RepID=A0A5B6WJW7_9ROSI|nr:hypothetical protein EPI10_021764 [Gossypium australe]